MIEEIRIGQLGVIDSSVLELGPGLTAITGETGAGKTMVVTALGLLLGGRADTGAVRSGAKQARVEGVVSAVDLPDLADAVDRAGGEVEDDRVVLARNVSAEGRSRAFVGGASVPVATLAEVAQPLVAVHGQSDQHRLLQARAQRDALDRFGGAKLAKLLTAYTETYGRLQAVQRELDEVTSSARERAREADLLRFGLGEVEAVSPESGEDVTLAAEESRLGFADTLRTAAEQAREALSSEEGAPDALTAVSAARGLLDGVREHDAEAGELADRIAEITYLLSDLAADVASYATRVDTDPSRLAAVSERRAALTALTRKYGDTVDEVLAWAEESARRLLDLDSTDERIDQLRTERDELRARLGGQAGALSLARAAAAKRLGGDVTAELTQLAMPHATVEIAVRQSEGDLPVGDRSLRYGSSGVDEVEFLLAANIGADARPLQRRALAGDAGAGGLARRDRHGADVRFRRGRRRCGWCGSGRGRAAPGPAGAERAGAGGHAPPAGGGVRRPPCARGEVE